jgi:hypothetical protein
VEERDFESLATSLKEIARSKNAFREMGLLASEFVAANFEQTAQVRQLESHYTEAVELAAERRPVAQAAPARVAQPFAAQVSAK